MIEIAESFINSMEDNIFIRPIQNQDIFTNRDLRKACEQNSCGKYGKNCMCPPGIGDIDSLISKVRDCGDGVLIQSVFTLEDSFDYEGMMNGLKTHSETFMNLKAFLEERMDGIPLFSLNAGSCSICSECAANSGEKCRFPEKAIASVESHGVDVANTLVNVGLKYNNGPGTVYYAGVILKRK